MQKKTKFIKKMFNYNQVQVFKNPKYESAVHLVCVWKRSRVAKENVFFKFLSVRR